MKYTSKETINKFNLNYNILKDLREQQLIPFKKQGRQYIYDINEELTKTFLNNDRFKNNSATSSPAVIDYNLGDLNLELPTAMTYGFNNHNKEQKRLVGEEVRDYYMKIFRRIALRPKVSSAVDEVVNEILTPFEDGSIVKVDFNNSKDLGDTTKKVLTEEFNKLLNILNFDNKADDLVRDWYIDGFLAIECIYDTTKTKSGIIEALKLDPIGLKGFTIDGKKYHKYSETSLRNSKIIDSETYKEEQIVFIGSGFWDDEKIFETSYLRVALKAINDLSHIENSIIKYRITRASEKNVWNIDVGSMPNGKARNHLVEVSTAIKSNIKYNTTTGEATTDVTEGITSDWIFPSRNGKQKTEVSTVNGNSDFISKLADLEYFRREVYEALKIPVGRTDGTSTLDYSSQDILREELKFSKFTDKLRRKFSLLFLELLKRHTINKGSISESDWKTIQNDIKFKWNFSNIIIENAEIESMKTKMDTFSELIDTNVIGKFISVKTGIKIFLNMTEEDFDEEQRQITKEKAKYKNVYKIDDEDIAQQQKDLDDKDKIKDQFKD